MSLLRDLGLAFVPQLSGKSAQVFKYLTYHWLTVSGESSWNPQISGYFFFVFQGHYQKRVLEREGN